MAKDKSNRKKFVEALEQIQSAIRDLKEIYNPEIDWPVEQIETAAAALDWIPKDEPYWDDYE